MLTVLAAAILINAGSVPFSGPGLNTHGQLLPVDKIKAIGIKWVRGDMPPEQLTERKVKDFVRHYQGMPILWIIQQKTPNAPSVAKDLRSWGITDLEVGNEPDVAEFSSDRRPWTAARYGRWFASIRAEVGSSMRLYGPATGVWMPDFVRGAIDNGMQADAISWHGYAKTIVDVAWTSSECERLFKLPSICSEIGFGEGPNYPVKLHPALAFMESKRKLGNIAWCYYDGPNGNADKRVGLFEWNGKNWETTTSTYDQIKAAVGGG